jgi:hypothetical protein
MIVELGTVTAETKDDHVPPTNDNAFETGRL